MRKKQGRIILFSSIITACSGLLFGFDTGIIADTQWQLSQQFSLSHIQWSLIVSSMVLGAFFGAICSSNFTENYGRKFTLQVTALLFIIGTLITSCTHQFITLFGGRFLLGISIGISSYCAPLFISEIALKKNRGRLVLLNNIAITGGEAIAFLAGYLLQDLSQNSWRFMFLLGILPAVVLWYGLRYVPSSPRWLIKKNQDALALESLKRIRNDSDCSIKQEFLEIKASLRKYSSDSLFAPAYRNVVLIGSVLGILQQVCGINAIMYYGPFLFKSNGFNESQALLATFVMGLLNTLCTIFAMFLVDSIGRKKLLMSGALICGLALGELANLQSFNQSNPWLSFTCIFIYIMAYAISLGSMFWLLISELYPLNIRAKAMSFTSSLQWLANFLVSICFLPMYDNFGGYITMLILSTFCFITVLFSYFYVPETKGLSLEQMQ